MANLALIALLAVLVIAGLIWGVRLSRRRHKATREIAAHNREIAAANEADGGAESGAADRRSGTDRRQTPRAGDDAPVRTVSPEVANAPTELIFDKLPDLSARYASPTSTAPAVDVPPPAAEVAPTPTPPPPPPANIPQPDAPVTQLKGLGAKLAAKLAEHGITTVGQIAALTDDQAAALDARLGPFTGRMARDRWQEQARFLAAGDQAGFEAVFGRL